MFATKSGPTIRLLANKTKMEVSANNVGKATLGSHIAGAMKSNWVEVKASSDKLKDGFSAIEAYKANKGGGNQFFALMDVVFILIAPFATSDRTRP